MDYEKMSDFEINKAVHFKILAAGKVKERCRLSDSDFVDVFRNEFGENPGPSVIAVMRYVKDGIADGYNPFGSACDYCNNPSDAWPIIFENKISITPTGGWWRARPEKTAWPEQFDDNPLRAAMLVFLITKEGGA